MFTVVSELLSTTEAMESETYVHYEPDTTLSKDLLKSARKLTNGSMTNTFTASEMAGCVLSAGHERKPQIDPVRIASVLGML